VSCIRGTKVQNLRNPATEEYLRVFSRCPRFSGSVRSECRRWLGRVIAVVTDGAFERDGCPRLPTAAARRDCVSGARRIDEPLVTFS
jgi:hypothetical protein